MNMFMPILNIFMPILNIFMPILNILMPILNILMPTLNISMAILIDRTRPKIDRTRSMEYDECPALQSWHTNHAPWGRGVWGKGLGRGLEKGLGSLKKRVSVVILNRSPLKEIVPSIRSHCKAVDCKSPKFILVSRHAVIVSQDVSPGAKKA